MNRNTIKIDSIVTIVNPNILIRVGYPLDMKTIFDEFTDADRTRVERLMCEFGITPTHNDRVREKILRTLAYELVAVRQFGGNTRSVHTRYDSTLKDCKCRVIGRKVHKTGERFAGSGGYDYWGEYDYTPGGLDNEKTHVFFRVSPYDMICPANEEIWIEKHDLGLIPPIVYG